MSVAGEILDDIRHIVYGKLRQPTRKGIRWDTCMKSECMFSDVVDYATKNAVNKHPADAIIIFFPKHNTTVVESILFDCLHLLRPLTLSFLH